MVERVKFNPVARPVDTVAVDTQFERLPQPVAPVRPMAPVEPQRPRAPMPSNVDQLAQALAALNPKINAAANRYFEEENKQEAIDAELRVLRDNVSSWSEAVAKDPSLADRSPVFRQVYESRTARNRVQSRAGELMQEYFNSEIATSEDPSAINAWLADRYKDVLDSAKTPAERAAIAEELSSMSQKFMSAHRENAKNNLIVKNRQSFSAAVSTTIDGMAARGPAAPYKTDDPVAAGAIISGDPKYGKLKVALLNALAGGESAGKYNIRYDGGAGSIFELNGQHPQIKVQTKYGPSDAAGRYQFLSSTWRRVMGNAPFTPENQDIAAIKLAEMDYASRTGKNLWEDIEAEGFSPRIQSVLTPTWQALGGNRGRHLATFNATLQRAGQQPKGLGAQNGYLPEMVDEVRKLELEGRKQGMSPKEINELTLEAVTNGALRHGDESILEAALQPRPDGTPGPGMTVQGREKLDLARKQIRSAKIQEQNHAWTMQQRAREMRKMEVKKLAMDGLIEQMKAGKAPSIPLETIQTASREDPELGEALINVQKTMDDVNKQEDPIAVGRFQAQVYSGNATPADVFDMVAKGVIRERSTINNLMEQASRNINRSIVTRPELKKHYDSIEQIIGQSVGPGMPKEVVANSQATTAFTRSMLEFEKNNPNATDGDRFEYADKEVKRLVKIYRPDFDMDAQSPEAITKRREEAERIKQDAAAGKVVPVQPGLDWKKARFFDSPEELDQAVQMNKRGEAVTTKLTRAIVNYSLNKKTLAEFIVAQRNLAAQKPAEQQKKESTK